jgi:hypothetical protein
MIADQENHILYLFIQEEEGVKVSGFGVHVITLNSIFHLGASVFILLNLNGKRMTS